MIQRNLVRAGEKGDKLILKGPKTEESTRAISISDNILELLRKDSLSRKENKMRLGALYQDNNFIFTTEDRQLINPASFSHRFGDFIRSNNLKEIRLHDLRHTNATLMLDLTSMQK